MVYTTAVRHIRCDTLGADGVTSETKIDSPPPNRVVSSTALLAVSPCSPSSTMWGWLVAVIFGLYLLPHVLVSLLPSQDLKKKVRPVVSSGDCCNTAW